MISHAPIASHPISASPEPTATFPAPLIARGRRRSRTGRCIRTGLPFHTGKQPLIPALLAPRVAKGLRRVRIGNVARISPRLVDYARRYAAYSGMYRIFNAAEYRLYRSNSGPPQEGDTPFATAASLPATPANTFADGTWYLSVSYFNGILDSGFLPLGPAGETYLRLDIDGDTADSPPQAPSQWRLEARAAGVVRIIGLYRESTTNRAEQWAIAYATDGSTPPVDTPDLTHDMPSQGLAVLNYDLPAQSHAATVKVRLQTRRNIGTDLVPIWIYSEDSEVKSLAADAVGPSAPPTAETWPGVTPEDLA